MPDGEGTHNVNAPEPADVERLRAALAAANGEPASPVDPARIFDALHAGLSDQERQALVDEMAGDPEALEAWRLAMELAPDSTPAVSAVSPKPASTWKWLGIAAGLLLSVGLAWQLAAPWRQAEAPAYRSTDPRSIASLLPEGEPLSREEPVLRWTAIDNARYRVRVFTADLQPLAEAADLSTPTYRLPADLVNRLPGAAVVLWQVEADVPGAATIVSPTFTARLP